MNAYIQNRKSTKSRVYRDTKPLNFINKNYPKLMIVGKSKKYPHMLKKISILWREKKLWNK
jgi:hypothetical protein